VTVVKNYQEISIGQLVPFANHPFSLYEGQRFTDMVESIRANGVISPIIVRPTDNDTYEILSGHNRVNAAREAGLTEVPAIVKNDLTDEDALLIVTETNLVQRSFADMKHSERAAALSVLYEAMKKKSGYRSDLLKEIDEQTSARIGRRLETRDKLGIKYGLSKTTVARYLLINKLIPALKERLDDGKITMQVAENLSALSESEQAIIAESLGDKRKLTIKQVELLRGRLTDAEFSRDFVEDILNAEISPAKSKARKFRREAFSEYFNDDMSDEEVEAEIAEILKAHFNK